ncbi:MAG: type II toxin-antitoxin system RelE/ParE family toxin [bacterium]|nr:type II toxin-antitoxin system RelE/ParE family toxin [bacterium]
MSRYALLEEARNDLQQISDYLTLEKANPVAAERVLFAALKTFELIAERPHAYPYHQAVLSQAHGLRKRTVKGYKKYLVFYRMADEDRVDIVRVLHGARDIPELLMADTLSGNDDD